MIVTYQDPITGETARKKLKGAEQKGPKGESASLKIGQEWLQKIEKGLLPDADKITLWEWLSRWLNDYAKPRLRVKSFDKYESCLRLYVKPTLGEVAMVKLKAADIRRLVQRLLTEEREVVRQQVGKGENKFSETKKRKRNRKPKEIIKRKGLSSLTVRNTRRYLIMALDQAVKEGMLIRNVARDVDPPKLVRTEIRPLTKEETAALIEAAKKFGEMPYMAILLALSTGVRLGELFGLKWDCVDLEKGVIYIKRSIITSHGSKNEFQEPKTAKSRRQIPLPAEVAKELRKYKKWQEWQINFLGDKYEDNVLVLASMWGRVVETSNFSSKTFKGMLEKAGIPKTVKFHDLRHTHATLLLQEGVNPKVVQERLGHSTISMTLDTYSHVLPDMQDTAVKALEKVFAGGMAN